MSKKKITIFASDLNENTGEGILARIFIKKLSLKYNKAFIDIITPNQKFKFKGIFNNVRNRSQNNIFHKYLDPIIGALKLRYMNNNKNIIYINYLPLWNFLIFLILPQHTILGPITGTNIVKDKQNINKLIRKYFFPLFFNISLAIINKKFEKIIFSTNILEKYFHKIKSKFLSNYVLNSFKINTNKSEKRIHKKYDVIFYNRNHRNKFNKDLIKIIDALSKTRKVCIIGDKFLSFSKNILNFGYIPREKVNKIMRKTRFAICGQENLYTFFAIDAYNHGCQLISDRQLKIFQFAKSKNFHFIDYKYSEINIKKILKILNKNKFQKDIKFKQKILKKKNYMDNFIKLY